MKAIKIILILIGISLNTFGQFKTNEIGIVCGPSCSFFNIGSGEKDEYNSSHKIIVFSVGLSYQHSFNNWFSVKTNLSYERKGDLFKTGYMEVNPPYMIGIEKNRHLDYITLPILIRGDFGKKTKLFFNIGPFFSFLTNASIRDTYSYNTSLWHNNSESYKNYDIGITSGLGVKIPANEKISISFEIRDNIGIMNISTLEGYTSKYLSTHSINLLLGFSYKICKQK
jgi:hypothetical protein